MLEVPDKVVQVSDREAAELEFKRVEKRAEADGYVVGMQRGENFLDLVTYHPAELADPDDDLAMLPMDQWPSSCVVRWVWGA